jgi:prepilin peptidase CpaA
MPQEKLFPDPAFAWTFYLVVVGITVVASYLDLRTTKIPKQLSLAALGLGVLFTVARGAWLGLENRPVWFLGAYGPWAGAADGLLLALAGVALSFFALFLLWILGACAGGDVKLFAALGAWLGPVWAIYVLAGTVVLVIVLSVVRLGWALVTAGPGSAWKDFASSAAKPGAKGRGKGKAPAQGFIEVRPSRRILMKWSVPLALSTALVLLWVFRAELQLADPPAQVSQARVSH